MKIDITCRVSGRVLFSHEAEGNTIKLTLEVADRGAIELIKTHAKLWTPVAEQAKEAA